MWNRLDHIKLRRVLQKKKKKTLGEKVGQQGAEGGKVFANGISNKSLAPKNIF